MRCVFPFLCAWEIQFPLFFLRMIYHSPFVPCERDIFPPFLCANDISFPFRAMWKRHLPSLSVREWYVICAYMKEISSPVFCARMICHSEWGILSPFLCMDLRFSPLFCSEWDIPFLFVRANEVFFLFCVHEWDRSSLLRTWIRHPLSFCAPCMRYSFPLCVHEWDMFSPFVHADEGGYLSSFFVSEWGALFSFGAWEWRNPFHFCKFEWHRLFFFFA